MKNTKKDTNNETTQIKTNTQTNKLETKHRLLQTNKQKNASQDYRFWCQQLQTNV